MSDQLASSPATRTPAETGQAAPVAAGVLSVIIVTYNSRQEIGACLQSVPQKLGGRPVEILVVDNTSTDGTLEFVRANFPNVTALSAGGNVGFGAANNIGFARSKGEFLLFLNPDTVLNEAALEHCLRRVREEPEVGILSPKLVLANGEMDLACRRSVPTVWDGVTRGLGLYRLFPKTKCFAGYNLTYLPENDTYQVGAVNGAFMMIRRCIFSQIGAFDDEFFMYGDDLDLCLRCSRQGFKVVYDGRYSVIHLKGCSSSKNYKVMSRALFAGTKQFYLKHFNPKGSLLVRWKYEVLFWIWRTAASILGTITGRKAARPT